MPAAIGNMQGVIPKMQQGVKRAIGNHPNVATFAAITS
jgi:hypothetical protein